MDDNTEMLSDLTSKLGLVYAGKDHADAHAQIVQFVNHLIINDFEKLVSLLYRLDINEKKINDLLKGLPTVDAAEIITNLMIEREQEKILTRKNFKSFPDDLAGEEKW